MMSYSDRLETTADVREYLIQNKRWMELGILEQETMEDADPTQIYAFMAGFLTSTINTLIEKL